MAFSFGTNPTTTAGGTGLTFGTPTTTSAFGAPSATPAFGTGTATAPSTFGSGSLFGASTSAAPTLNLSTTGTGFGAAPAPAAAPATGNFSFGASTAPATAPAAGNFSFGASTASSAFSFGAAKPTTTAAGMAPTSTTSAFGSTGLGGAMPAGGGFSFPTATNTTVASAPTGTGAATCVASGPQGAMTFEELEKKCNEWKKELEFQEESFLKRATQINAWDRLISANAEKITELHEYMKKVRSDQDRMDREVDFVVAQQKELEEMLGPLEQEALALEPTSIQHHTDFERQTTYNSATTVNAQLRGMAERIKDIIEHINANNKSGNDASSLSQITKILNAHVDVLQFIQNGIDTLQQKTEDVNKLLATARI